MDEGLLVEFGGLPGTGKSTLARRLAAGTGAVWLRIDEIENAMRRQSWRRSAVAPALCAARASAISR